MTGSLDRRRFGGRAAAHAALGRILRRRIVLDEALEMDGLEERDRAFARLLVAGTLRRLGQIEALLAGCLDRPLPKGAAPVMDVLRLGVFQLVFLGTAPHAAVDEAVEMTGALGFAGYRRLVNAVLRRLADLGRERMAEQDAAALDTPAWLWESWTAAYGADLCRAIADVHQGEPPLDLTVRADSALWAERLGGEVLPTGSVRLPGGGAVSRLDGFTEGAWWVQDAAAALPARLFPSLAGKEVADLCAAPGGKTAQLALAGAQVVALDRSAKRLERLAANMARLGLAVRTQMGDATRWRPGTLFDAILLDAPCSATGTLRRHPDIAYLKRPGDIGVLTTTQDRLLDAAAGLLKPGGVLVYCTCSLQPDEGERRIEALAARGVPLRPSPIEPGEVAGCAEFVTARGYVRTLPCHLPQKGGMDGFFAARLIRE